MEGTPKLNGVSGASYPSVSTTCGWYILWEMQAPDRLLAENGFLDLGIRSTHKGRGRLRDKAAF